MVNNNSNVKINKTHKNTYQCSLYQKELIFILGLTCFKMQVDFKTQVNEIKRECQVLKNKAVNRIPCRAAVCFVTARFSVKSAAFGDYLIKERAPAPPPLCARIVMASLFTSRNKRVFCAKELKISVLKIAG